MRLVLFLAVLLGACSASRPAGHVMPAASLLLRASGNPDRQTGVPVPPPHLARSLREAARVEPSPANRVTPSPEPTDDVGTAIMSGLGKWYDDGPGLYAATSWWHWGLAPQRAHICGDNGCAWVTIRDHMTSLTTLVDLGPDAFRAVCGPLGIGRCTVTLEVQ